MRRSRPTAGEPEEFEDLEPIGDPGEPLGDDEEPLDAPRRFEGTPAERTVRALGRLALVVLLAALLALAAGFDLRSRAPVGDEPTYLLQALSLAHDLDLAFDDGDHRRFTATYGDEPGALVLQSRDGGGRVTYGVPFLWALWAAPFVRVSPLSGAAVANALLLALAAWVAARALERSIGPAAWLWTAVLCFASVAFGHAFFALPDLALLAASTVGLALVYGGAAPAAGLPELYGEPEDDGGGRRALARWVFAGALLAVPAVHRPVYATLLAAAALAAPAPRRGRRIAARVVALGAGALAVAALAAAGQWAAGGGWTAFGGDRRAFAAGGYPGIDFPAAEWPGPRSAQAGAAAVAPGTADPALDAKLWGWNLVYLVAGRNAGLVPYFLPGLAILTLAGGWRRGALAAGGRRRWALAAAVAAALVALLWLRPFGFAGGSEALANRYFLPLYPALWFLAARGGGSAVRRALGALAAAALAAPLLLPLWRAPAAHPVGEDGRFRHVSALAGRWLPFETSQPVPAPRAAQGELTVSFLAGDAGPAGGGGLRLRGRRPVEVLVASPEPLERLVLAFGRRTPSRLEIEAGGEVADVLLRADGGIWFAIDLAGPRAVHPTAAGPAPVHFYRLSIRLPEAPPFDLPFTVRSGGW